MGGSSFSPDDDSGRPTGVARPDGGDCAVGEGAGSAAVGTAALFLSTTGSVQPGFLSRDANGAVFPTGMLARLERLWGTCPWPSVAPTAFVGVAAPLGRAMDASDSRLRVLASFVDTGVADLDTFACAWGTAAGAGVSMGIVPGSGGNFSFIGEWLETPGDAGVSFLTWGLLGALILGAGDRFGDGGAASLDVPSVPSVLAGLAAGLVVLFTLIGGLLAREMGEFVVLAVAVVSGGTGTADGRRCFGVSAAAAAAAAAPIDDIDALFVTELILAADDFTGATGAASVRFSDAPSFLADLAGPPTLRTGLAALGVAELLTLGAENPDTPPPIDTGDAKRCGGGPVAD
jgi:hypothetical protein